MTSTLTSKGQVTVPKKYRDYLGLQPGAKVEFALGQSGEVIVCPAPVRAVRAPTASRFGKLHGTLDTGKTTDELMALLRGYGSDEEDPGLA